MAIAGVGQVSPSHRLLALPPTPLKSLPLCLIPEVGVGLQAFHAQLDFSLQKFFPWTVTHRQRDLAGCCSVPLPWEVPEAPTEEVFCTRPLQFPAFYQAVAVGFTAQQALSRSHLMPSGSHGQPDLAGLQLFYSEQCARELHPILGLLVCTPSTWDPV